MWSTDATQQDALSLTARVYKHCNLFLGSICIDSMLCYDTAVLGIADSNKVQTRVASFWVSPGMSGCCTAL